MQVNGFKKSVFGGLKKTEVLMYLEQMSRDVETKIRNKDDDIRELKKELSDKKDKVKDLKQELEAQKEAYEKKLSQQEKDYTVKKAGVLSIRFAAKTRAEAEMPHFQGFPAVFPKVFPIMVEMICT